MMLQAISTANIYIEQLRRSLQQVPDVNIDWLVFAHNDAQLLARLDQAFPESVLAVIVLPQNRWQMQEEMMADVITWAIRDVGVKGVLLVGHSQAQEPPEMIKLLGGKAAKANKKPAKTSTNTLLQRIQKAQTQSADLQNQLATQVDRLSHMTLIQSKLIMNEMQLHGLFYRAESGLFYIYDQQHRGFRPLFNEAAA